MSVESGVGVADDAALTLLLNQMQQWLWSQFKWSFLFGHEDIATVVGTRYYTLPTTISLDYPTEVETKWGEWWYDVGYGIRGEQYAQCDPDQGETRDPIERWQTYSVTQLEVWPSPSTGQTLRFWGTKMATALVSDGNTAVLDDNLIVLFAAAERLARAKQSDAAAKLSRANALFHRLKAANRPNTSFVLGGDEPFYKRDQRIVTVIGNTP